MEGDQGKPNIEFTQDGVLKAAELKIMNLRPGVSKQLVWEEVRDISSTSKKTECILCLVIAGIIYHNNVTEILSCNSNVGEFEAPE